MRTLLPVFLAAAGLCGCAAPLDAPLSPAFGQAVATMQAQVIPVAVSDLPPESSAARSVAAIGRYEKGEVKRLETQATSVIGGYATTTTGSPGK
ncbi:hypothetical protein DJ021_13815 [Phenylobacterium hankyongense]|uniref:Uncharacterized protein n=1 Tax=Phenylobacterium hankyongense TaxID=1813876 RepID=A0A328B718_9CAUL|nr:hypothetical protein [Phenylobacterium hankyongense]RAK60808.1 hypothetical protein DJ021_13815 [Phenylobacterium hankyongense]